MVRTHHKPGKLAFAAVVSISLSMPAAHAIDLLQPNADSNFANNVKQSVGNLQDERSQRIREYKQLKAQALTLIEESENLRKSASGDAARYAQLTAQIDTIKGRMAKQQEAYNAVAAKSDYARRSKPFWKFWDTDEEKAAKKEFKELERLQKEQSQIALDLEQARQNAEFSLKAAEKNRSRAQEIDSRADDLRAKSLGFLKGDPSKLSSEEIANLVNSTETVMIAERVAQEEFDRMRNSYYDAKFLLTDLNTLQAKHGLNEEEIKGLKAAVKDQLDHTLMGKYIDKKLNDALAQVCERKNACTNFGGLTDAVEALRSNRKPAKEYVGPHGEVAAPHTLQLPTLYDEDEKIEASSGR